jgi:two-component system sensor histidine kinase AlgZ
LTREPQSAPESPALPDFCQPRAVFFLVVLGALLALLLALAASPQFERFWLRFGLASIMIEIIVLASSGLLCLSRPLLARMAPRGAFLTVFLVIQALVVGFSLIAAAIFDTVIPGGESADWVLRNLLISLVASLVFVRYLVLHRQWQLQVRAEAGARLDALQARIRPHFLFNALNTIASLIRSRPADAEEAVLDLSELLRTGLRPGGRHTLAEELELVRGYLRIEAQRLGDRLTIDWHIADDLPTDEDIPALLIQPLVENAIVHGIALRADGGTLAVRGGRAGSGYWEVVVENPLAGDTDEPATGVSGNRMALENIAKRIDLAWGERARLVTRASDGRFTATLRAPIGE